MKKRSCIAKIAAVFFAVSLSVTPVMASEPDTAVTAVEEGTDIDTEEETTVESSVTASEEVPTENTEEETEETTEAAGQPGNGIVEGSAAEEEEILEETPAEDEAAREAAEHVVVIGVYVKNGKKYYMGGDGGNMKGWIQGPAGEWYYADKNGVLQTGLKRIKKKDYYLDPATCRMETGAVKVKGKWYFFDTKSGAKKTGTGWCQDKDGSWYYAGNKGVLRTGWITVKKSRYYMDPSTCRMVTGAVRIGKKWYGFAPSGALVKNGTSTDDHGNRFCTDKNGILKTGWHTFSKKKYYFDPDTHFAVKGKQKIGGVFYYFDPVTGAAKENELIIIRKGQEEYYAEASGRLATGWRLIGSQRRYFLSDGSSKTEGTAKIEDACYVFDKRGVCMGLDVKKYGDIPYAVDSMKDRVHTRKPSGKLTGVHIIGDSICYFDSKGVCLDKYTRSARYIKALTEEERAAALIMAENLLSSTCGGIAKTKNDVSVKVSVAIRKTYMDFGHGSFYLYSKRDEQKDCLVFMYNSAVDHQSVEKNITIRKIIRSSLTKSGAMKKKSVRDRVRALDAYICRTLRYDSDYLHKDFYETAVKNRGVCADYSEMFFYLCREAGIPCRLIDGTVKGGGAHSWNQVKIDGKWLNVDTLWDDAGNKSNGKWLLKSQLNNHIYKCVSKTTE